MKLRVTPEDVLRTKLVDQGWHTAVVKDVREEPAGTDGTTNWYVKCIIREGGKFDGVPIERVFNEKAPGFALSYLTAIGYTITDKTNEDFEISKGIGKTVEVLVKNSEWNGRMSSKIDDFRPARTAQVA